ncbi:unnamed protein product [Closterium sp. NIES-53]
MLRLSTPRLCTPRLSAEDDCYLCVPPDPGIEAAALGASESALSGTAPAKALHTFTLDSGASRCLHLPSFSTNLVSTASLQDAMVTTTTPGGQRVSICTCTRTGRHLATFTRRPGSSLYTLATKSPQTLLWHHRHGHPSLPRLRGMHSRLLVSGLPRSLPPLPPSPTPPCLPCVEGRQRAAPHSFSFPPTTAPLQTLHMDVWGPARVSGQGRERYFLLVVDDYTHYTTVFPLRSKGEDLPVLRLHSDRGGEFSSNLLRDFCRGEGILHSFTPPASPQQNGIAECRIGLVMEFYHPTSRRVLPSQDVTFDESTLFYHPVEPVEVAFDFGAAGGRATRGAESGGAVSASAGPGAVQPGPQHQLRSRETPSPQQLREWYAGRQGSGGAGPCTYVLRTGDRTGEQCGGLHATQRCFGHLTDAWRSQFPDATEIPRWGDLLGSGVAIFDLDFDAILAAMYAVSISAEGDCYVCVPPDPGIQAAALGASESAAPGARESAAPSTSASALSGTASAQVLHTFTLDSGASRSFFRDRTTLTPLSRPVAVSLADPSGGPVLARYSTVLPCPAAPSGSLSGLYLPSFSTKLVSGADLQDGGADQFTPASQRMTHCTCARTGRHLATFTRRPGSSLYTLTTESPPVAASGQVVALSQVFAAASRSGPESAPCSCRLLSHQTLLWHHRLDHPSLPRLRGMASRVLVSCLPRSLPPLPPRPAPTCIPCVEGRQRAAPHSSDFPPTEAPLQTLHMDVWGPARVRGQGHERYFLLVVDDYSRYTTVFPLRRKDEVTEVLID